MEYKVDDQKEITCSSGKVGFKSKRSAERAIRCINSHNGGDRLRAYYCKECGQYHLTTNHIIESRMLKKSYYCYNRLQKKAEDRMILQFSGVI